MAFRTLDQLQAAGKRVLLRADLNVPMHEGRVGDLTRLERLTPTIRELAAAGAKVIVLSHFDRPKGKRVPEMSLRPVAAALGEVLGRTVGFADDCIGAPAEQAVSAMGAGDVLVLENTRYHAGEEKNDAALAKAMAALGDVFVNDAFSAAHRAHASTEGLAHLLPAYAGRLMQKELEALGSALGNPKRPVAAIVGGAKVSTKLDLLGNLVGRVDLLVIGGAMANTFLAARGLSVGKSLQEADLHDTAREIEAKAKAAGCTILLPSDAVVAREFRAHAPSEVVPVTAIPADAMVLDVGPLSVADLLTRLAAAKTLVWNGPLGAFETEPFDAATVRAAKGAAALTQAGSLLSVAGGGDTVAALRHAGVAEQFSYVSTAGGAFLEWLEGKTLPGVAALEK
ncbi:MAG: phosphoglycerate kinase [Acetobacteraceae bacterium]|jgi:phosphoglycerate kinase|nr:phosphoglycerate kinase [Acetobacteraceae bacterium]